MRQACRRCPGTAGDTHIHSHQGVLRARRGRRAAVRKPSKLVSAKVARESVVGNVQVPAHTGNDTRVCGVCVTGGCSVREGGGGEEMVELSRQSVGTDVNHTAGAHTEGCGGRQCTHKKTIHVRQG